MGYLVPIKKKASEEKRSAAAGGGLHKQAEGVKRDGPGTGLPGPLRGEGILLVLVT